jgi:hypothetical protein
VLDCDSNQGGDNDNEFAAVDPLSMVRLPDSFPLSAPHNATFQFGGERNDLNPKSVDFTAIIAMWKPERPIHFPIRFELSLIRFHAKCSAETVS